MTASDAAGVIIDLLRRGHAVQFRVRGDSMHPFIRENDVLHVEAGREVQVGDVVLVLAERGLTAHRVVARDGDRVVTRGDNAPAPDAPVTLTQILGMAASVERNGKRSTVRRKPVIVAFIRLMRRLVRRSRRSQ